MKPLLIAEAIPAEKRTAALAHGLATGSEVYQRAVRAIAPALAVEVVAIADPGPWHEPGFAFDAFAGVVIGGSSLNAWQPVPEVARQVEFLRKVTAAGLPVLGSCWGLQIAAIAAGGEVVPNERGREVGVARKIVPTAAGQSHPLLSGKGGCFDALCIHYDEVRNLPADCQVLAGNSHSAVQAAIVPLGRSEVWGLQYHPEFDLQQVAGLLRHYRRDMLAQKFFGSDAELDHYVMKWEALAADPDNAGLAWQLGLDRDTLDPAFHRLEIANWLRAFVL